eukprot:TRINITY_DN18469_c0_g1_i1.p1 TRINITY_DN18469_c0_g1~~TRINITY_DN18469_c0_g1_i1.p1  ORF type:complete len:499 (+),score=185.96 TRINITY_DN18469_c0_g1_i1:78-1499(+)
MLGLAALAAAAAGAAGRNWTDHALGGDAVCINGQAAAVSAWIGDPEVWVIQLGDPSPGIDICISLDACKLFASQKELERPRAAVAGAVTAEGPQSGNCTLNPDWCKASQAQIPMCDFAFLMGSRDLTDNGTTMHFRGLQILAAAVQTLAQLGMAKAKRVLLTGYAQGGTAVYLHADRIAAMVRKAAPQLSDFKALPVDGFHANMFQTLFCTASIMQGNCHHKDGTPAPIPSWYTGALQQNANLSGAAAAVHPECAARVGKGKEYLCLYANETLPHIQTPIFAVNQLISVWDAQCMAEGQVGGPLVLQVACSERGNYFRDQYTCVQYPDLCSPTIIKDWWAPTQQQYLDDFTRSGVHKKPGNGGFFHQCYLGSYWESDFSTTDPAKVPRQQDGIWNEIAVGGKTMRQAVSDWWHGTGAEWRADKVWDPAGQPPSGAVPPPVNLTAVGLGIEAPGVPWYTARWMHNPSCRGFPWY